MSLIDIDQVKSVLAFGSDHRSTFDRSDRDRTHCGIAWTSWPLRNGQVTTYGLASWSSLATKYGKCVEANDNWFIYAWDVLEAAWFSKSANPRPPVVLIGAQDHLEEAISFAKENRVGLVLVKTVELGEEAKTFFEEYPSASVFQTYSKENDQTFFILKDGLCIEPLANLRPAEGLMIVQRLCPSSFPKPLSMASDIGLFQDRCKSIDLISLQENEANEIETKPLKKHRRVSFQEPPLTGIDYVMKSPTRNGFTHDQAFSLTYRTIEEHDRDLMRMRQRRRFEDKFHDWRRMRNLKETCISCTCRFCPHRSFPYYVTTHPDKAPTRFRCGECQARLDSFHSSFHCSYQRSTRLTDRAAKEMMERCLNLK